METFSVNDHGVFKRLAKATGPQFTRKTASEFGTIAVNFSKERFRRKDWQDRVHQPWKPRKRKDRGSLMVKSGRLKRSIKKMATGTDYVIIGSDVPYAKVHNEGGKTHKTVYVKEHNRRRTTHASTNLRTRKKSKKRVDTGLTTSVKSHTRKMNLTVPQRQFMGKSRALEIRLMRHLKQKVNQQVNRNL